MFKQALLFEIYSNVYRKKMELNSCLVGAQFIF